MSDTPRTTAATLTVAILEGEPIKMVPVVVSEDMERELTYVTEQRDKALQKIKNQAERIVYLEGATNHATGTPLSKAIEQRDRLAKALEEMRYAHTDKAERMANEAFQSLTTNEQ